MITNPLLAKEMSDFKMIQSPQRTFRYVLTPFVSLACDWSSSSKLPVWSRDVGRGGPRGSCVRRPRVRRRGLWSGGWRKHGGWRQRRTGRRDRAAAADPEPTAGATGGECHCVSEHHHPVLLPGDVVWCVPLGTGLLPFLSHTRWVVGSVYPSSPQVWKVYVGGHPADGHCGTNICWDINKCRHCWGIQSRGQGNVSHRGARAGCRPDFLRASRFLFTDFSNFVTSRRALTLPMTTNMFFHFFIQLWYLTMSNLHQQLVPYQPSLHYSGISDCKSADTQICNSERRGLKTIDCFQNLMPLNGCSNHLFHHHPSWINDRFFSKLF